MHRRASCSSDTTEVSVNSTSSRRGATPQCFNSPAIYSGSAGSSKERPEILIASDGTSASAFPLEKALRGCAGYRRLMSTCERR